MKRFLLIFAIGVSLGLGSKSNPKENVQKCTGQGTCYLGSWQTTEEGTNFAAFRGVRYAQPPVGDLRFKTPQALNEGETTVDVSNNSKVQCAQYIYGAGMTVGDEDCLFLHIYIPEKAILNEETFPVMVFIHGGGLLTGEAFYDQYGPHYFMEKDVILVTMSYRLGSLGFLYLGIPEAPGNVGIRDQVMALQWIKNNIAFMNGDPNAVTIFGQSGGSQSVGLLLSSPLTRGLFQRAILESGTAWLVSGQTKSQDEALNQSMKIGQDLGCDDAGDELLKCLQSKTVAQVLLETDNINYPVPDNGIIPEPLFPDTPEELTKSGQFHKDVGIIIGQTKDEGILYLAEPLLDPNIWSQFTPEHKIAMLLFGIREKEDIAEKDVEKAKKVVEFYLGPDVEDINAKHIPDLMKMFTDSMIHYDNFKMIDYLRSNGVEPYFYMLTYQGNYSLTDFFGVEPLGVCHGDELFYLWHNLLNTFTVSSQQDIAVKKVMVDAWTNFASSGDPTPGSDQPWKMLQAGADSPIEYWNIDSSRPSMNLVDSDYLNRMDFWKTLEIQ